MCRVIPCPILLVRASCIACHGSAAQQQSAFTLDYIVPYCRCVRDVPTLKMRVVLFLVCIKNSTISSKNDHCCILVQVACFFFLGWDLAFIERTYLVCAASSRVLYCWCVLRIILSSRATTTAFSSPYTQNNISYFGGMYRKKQHHQQACTLLYKQTYPPRDTTSMDV